MRTGKHDSEILVSHRSAPSCITTKDIIKAIDLARHQMPHHYAPALEAAQRLFRLATPEQMKQARIADDREDRTEALLNACAMALADYEAGYLVLRQNGTTQESIDCEARIKVLRGLVSNG